MHAPPTGLSYTIYYTALAVIAVPGEQFRALKTPSVDLPECAKRTANLVTVGILSRGKCGLSRCITLYLVSMSVTDFLVIVTAVIINRICRIYFPGSFLDITPVCSFTNAFTSAARLTSVWLTVTFTFDRFVAISCQKLKANYCTEKTATVVIGTVCAIGCLINIPWYFVHEPIYVIDGIPWYCRLREIRHTSPAWITFVWFDRIATPCVPFLLILLLNALTVRQILVASRARKRLRAESNVENQNDAEMESRRKSIILLFAISWSFILLWMAYVVQFLYVRIASNYKIQNNDPIFILREAGNMLQLLSSCTNTFIYTAIQSKFRAEFNKLARYPFTMFSKLISKSRN
ncbi:probable G-protein coupled receptor 139 [Leucoraja erinacea]|uniref:probable G-protein coupled receptor 139 n=1 Tax=Leucoraja erinaceus TaxID=7782 RepID=UPI002454C2E1|nr:probable G-protein coupled receptor 139 [Leucoraja erinacea]